MRSDTNKFGQWTDETLVPLMPGGEQRWRGFPGGVYLKDSNPWVVRAVLVQGGAPGATLWAYAAPLFDDHLPLVLRPLTYAAKQAWIDKTVWTDSNLAAAAVSEAWLSSEGETHLARFEHLTGLLDWIHGTYREEPANRMTHGSVEACCYIILGDLDSAMRAATVPRTFDDEPYHREEQFAQIRVLIEAGPDAAMEHLARIREEQWKSFMSPAR